MKIIKYEENKFKEKIPNFIKKVYEKEVFLNKIHPLEKCINRIENIMKEEKNKEKTILVVNENEEIMTFFIITDIYDLILEGTDNYSLLINQLKINFILDYEINRNDCLYFSTFLTIIKGDKINLEVLKNSYFYF
jgi:hypothetical protein